MLSFFSSPPITSAEKWDFIEEHGHFQPHSRRKMKKPELHGLTQSDRGLG